MKRSEINSAIKDTINWLEELKVHLPPFAYWTPEEWATLSGARSFIPSANSEEQ